jgi:dihydroorotate dehydrogenase electron transfer subunit
MFDEIVHVTENRLLSGGHFLLSVESPRHARVARPAQFAMLRILGCSDALLRRPMNIYDLKRGNGNYSHESISILQFLYKAVGRGTCPMSEPKQGDRLGVLWPLGHGFFEERRKG